MEGGKKYSVAKHTSNVIYMDNRSLCKIHIISTGMFILSLHGGLSGILNEGL